MATTAGSLSYPGISSQGNKTEIVAGNTEDINLPLAKAITGTAYYSALINVPNLTGQATNDTTGNSFLSLGTLSESTPPTLALFSGRLYIKAGAAANTFKLGVLNGAGGTANPTFSTKEYSINKTHFVVVKYDLSKNTATLFVNPTVGGTEAAAAAINATGNMAAPTRVSRLVIREAGSAASGTGNVQIDEIKIGESWDAVTSGDS